MRRTCLATVLVLLLAGCSSDQLYASGRNAQRNTCMKQADAAARDRCMQDAGMSHDVYRKEADGARK
jgi:uncharacterized protein YcfL